MKRRGYFTNGVFSMQPAPPPDEDWWMLDMLVEQNVPCWHEPSHLERMAGEVVNG